MPTRPDGLERGHARHGFRRHAGTAAGQVGFEETNRARNQRGLQQPVQWETLAVLPMILTLTLNPAIDLALGVRSLATSERAFIRSEAETAGGKGINAARVIHAYGGKTLAVAPIGGRRGGRFAELLRAEGLPAELVPVQGETRRNVAITDRRGRTVKVDQKGVPPSTEELLRIERAVERRLPDLSWLMLNGSVAPGTRDDIYHRLAEKANWAGVRVLVDTSGPALAASLAAEPSLVKPNLSEAEELLGRNLPTVRDAIKAAEEIRDRGAKNVLLSLGARGAIGARAEGALLARVRTARTGSAVGAGDVLAATCVWALGRGEPFEEALRWGVGAATAAASLAGLEFGSASDADAVRGEVEVIAC